MSELGPGHRFRIIPHAEEMHHWHLGRPVAQAAPAPGTLALASVVFTTAFVGSLYLAPQSVLAAQTQPLIEQGRASVDAALGYAAHAERVLAARTHVVLPRLSLDTRTFGARLEVAQAAAAETSGSFGSYLAALWDQLIHGNEVTATNTEPASLYVAPSTRVASPPTGGRPPLAPAGSAPAPSMTIITQPVVERVVTQSVPVSSGVSASLLASSLQSLRDDLLNRISGISIPAPTVPSVPIQAFAASQRIDALSGTTLTNIIVKGVSGLTAGDIPALAYLATSGGTITGDLTISGALSAAALAVSSIASSGAIEAPYFTATSTTASTFPNLLATNATTTNATSTNLYAASLVAGSATSTNLFSTVGHFTTGIIDTLTSTVATITSLTASNLTATNATTTSATTTNFAITGTGTSMLLSTDSTGRVIATSSPAAANFIATSSTASQFPYASSTAVTVSGTASTTNLIASASFTLANLTGFLKATAGAVATSLVNLASDVTGILPVANGGTGWAAITAGTIPYGNGGASLATSSALTFDGTKLIATYASTTAITSSGSAYFATAGGNVGVGTTSPGYLFDLLASGSGNYKGMRLLSSDDAFITLGSTISSSQAWTYGATSNTSGQGANLFFIGTSGQNGAPITERFAIDSSGKVGIGTAAPSQNLDVVGTTKSIVYTGPAVSAGGCSLSGWYKVGSWNTGGVGGASLLIDFVGAQGFNGIPGTTGRTILNLNTGNGASFNISGYYYTEGGTPVLNGVKAVATAGSTGNNWDIYASYAGCEGNTFLKIDNDPRSTFLLSGSAASDPGTGATVYTVDNRYSITGGNVGIGTTNAGYLLTVNGSAAKPGGGSWTDSSDERLKTAIATIAGDDALAKILALNPVTFNWINPQLHGNATSSGGFLAQDMQRVFPDFVATTTCQGADCALVGGSASSSAPTFTLTLPFKFFGYLVAAVQELETQVKVILGRLDGQDQKITDLEARVAALEAVEDSAQGISPAVRVASGSFSAPTITLIGANPARVSLNDPYSDLGAIAKDNAGHDLSLRTFLNGALVSNIVIDTAAAATDTIDYVATDTWGNTSTSTRTVIVEAAAATSPATEPSTSTSTPPATVTAEVATSTATTSPSGQ